MNTPWGNSDHHVIRDKGLHQVDTPSHGGLMLTKEFAEKHISISARSRALLFNSYYCFEEDCDKYIVYFELPQYFGYDMADMNRVKEISLKALRMFHPDYLAEMGVQ